MKKLIFALLAMALVISLCACSVTDTLGGLFGGLFGGKPTQNTQEPVVTENVQALMEYAKRLEEAGNPEAAAEVYAKLGEAAQADAQYQAAAILESSSDYDLLRAVAKADLQGVSNRAEFTDVSESDWYYDAVQWAAKQQIVSGETFSPQDPCTRAQALTFLWRAKGKPASILKASPFTDVTADQYFFEPVLWAFENGLLSASNDGQFHPNDPVTRAQTAMFLYRAEGAPQVSEPSPYSDVTGDEWFAPAAIWTWREGIVTLNDTATFNAAGACARSHYVNFLYRCYG